MIDEKEETLIVKDENGVEKQYYKLFTCDSDTEDKSYIVYTDYSTDESGNVVIRANIYDSTGEDTRLLPITDEKEWKLINAMIKKFADMVDESGDENEKGK